MKNILYFFVVALFSDMFKFRTINQISGLLIGNIV